jgi:hypothetical protein
MMSNPCPESGSESVQGSGLVQGSGSVQGLVPNSYPESESIYQQVLKLHQDQDEQGILDLMDEVDPKDLDLNDTRILHMVHLYITLKRAIMEYNFLDLIQGLRDRSEKSRILYDLTIELITKTRTTGQIQCRELVNHQHQIDDPYFQQLIQSTCCEVNENPFHFNDFLAEKNRIYESKVQDNEFSLNRRLTDQIYREVIQYTKSVKSNRGTDRDSETAAATTGIISMIRNITKAITDEKYEEAMSQMSEFKKLYGERSGSFFAQFLLNIQFLTKPSYKHAMDYYHGHDELNELKEIPEIAQYIEYKKIRILGGFANKLRTNGLFEDADQLNQLIEKLHQNVPFYQQAVSVSLKINQLTIGAQKAGADMAYYDYLNQLIDTSYHRVSSHMLGDVIIITNRVGTDTNRFIKSVDFYNKYKQYMDYCIRKIPNFSHIQAVREIVRAHYVAKLLNSSSRLDQLFEDFGLNVEYFRQKQDHPVLKLVYQIYESVNGFIEMNLSESDPESVQTESVCIVCKETMDPRICCTIQYSECSQNIGHLFCLADGLKTGIKPCCGKIDQDNILAITM